jgi:4'-phosphopantetheinyl transferase EntD
VAAALKLMGSARSSCCSRQPGGVGVDVEQLMSDATANETADLLMNPQEQQENSRVAAALKLMGSARSSCCS